MKPGDLVTVCGTVGYDEPIDIHHHASALKHYSRWLNSEVPALVLETSHPYGSCLWVRVLVEGCSIWVKGKTLRAMR